MELAMRTQKSHRRSIRNFVPSTPAGISDSRLEPRSLAAPAFFRLAYYNDSLTLDFAQAQVTGLNMTTDTNTNDSSAGASGSSVVTSPDDSTTFTMAGLATTEVEDLADPGTGAPIGNFAIAMSFAGQIHYTTTGTDTGLVNQLGVNGSVLRNYNIADDAANETSPVSLVEHFNTWYAPPTSYGSTILGGAEVGTTSGFGVEVVMGVSGITSVAITGSWPGAVAGGAVTPTTSVSGTITPFFGPAGDSISYTYTSSEVDVTSTKVVGPFGLVGRDSSGNPTGSSFQVGFGAGIGDTAADEPGISDEASITAAYDAHFS
jgi:hypothetical protein